MGRDAGDILFRGERKIERREGVGEGKKRHEGREVRKRGLKIGDGRRRRMLQAEKWREGEKMARIGS